MAQAAGNSCLVCNGLIRSKRRQRDILESSGSHLTIRSRVENVLSETLEDSGSTWICDKCFADLEQIERYYSLVDNFRQRYLVAVEARRKGRGGKNSHLERAITSYAANILLGMDKQVDDQQNHVDIKEEIKDQKEESGCSCSESDEEEQVDVEASEDELGEIFSEAAEETYEVVDRGEEAEENSTGSDSDQSTYEVSYPNNDIKEEDLSHPESEAEDAMKKSTAKKKKVYNCPICGISSGKHKMKTHMKMHEDDAPFAARELSSPASQNGTADTSTNSDTDPSTLRFGCKECGKRFRSRYKLMRHTAYHIGCKPFLCTICDKKFTWSWHLQRHVKTHSFILPFMCCDKNYEDLNTLFQHMLLHKDLPSFECGLCSEKFSMKEQLKQHRVLIHGKTANDNKCNVCGKTFKRPNKLKAHMATHAEESSFKCSYCVQVFKTQGNLKVHERRHTGENLHKCKECGKVYTQAANLRVHMMSHTGERPYVCNKCGKGFMESNALKRHESIHTPDKGHACTECGKIFMRKDHLTKHMTIHSDNKPHLCITCGKGFGRLDKMKTHSLIHLKPQRVKKEKVKREKEETPKPGKPRGRRKKIKVEQSTAESSATHDQVAEDREDTRIETELTLYPSVYLNSSPDSEARPGTITPTSSHHD